MMTGWLDSMIIKQISTVSALFKPPQTPLELFGSIVFLVLFISSLYFFIFSLPFTKYKPAAYIQKIGRWGLMTMLGLYFGATVLTRQSMNLPATMFLLLGIRT